MYELQSSLVIKIPLLTMRPHVVPQENYSLDAVQQFLLEAVEMAATTENISRAMNLSLSMVESELRHLEQQELIARNDSGAYTLTAESHRLLLVSRMAKNINANAPLITVNRIDKGVVVNEDSTSDFSFSKSIDIIPLFSTDSIMETASLNDEEIQQVFMQAEAFAGLSDVDKQSVVDSLYIDEWESPEDKYMLRRIAKLPCYSTETEEQKSKKLPTAKGCFSVIDYLYQGKNYRAYFDTVSGKIHFDVSANEEKNSTPMKIALELPKLHSATDSEEAIVKELKAHYGLPDDAVLEKQSEQETEYLVSFSLSDLFGGDE